MLINRVEDSWKNYICCILYNAKSNNIALDRCFKGFLYCRNFTRGIPCGDAILP